MRYFIVLIVLAIYIFLFKKAAGTLKPNIMNVITFVFYSILGFELIGGSLVYLGFDNHYLIQKITLDTTVDKTYYILAYTSLMLPIIMILSNRYIFNIDKTKNNEQEKLETSYINKLKEKVNIEDSKKRNRLYICLLVLIIICLISIIYVFTNIGYIPILQYFNSDIDLAKERINISRNFDGNQYIKNLIMLLITPIVSYIIYIYMRATKDKKWKVLFGISFLLSILAITYNFEKSPILYYLLFFFVIEIMLGNTFKLKSFIPILCVCVVIILILYKFVFGYEGPIFSLSSGPIGRVLITQVSTLFLHVDAFPEHIPYLNGHSFPEIMTGFMGDGAYDVRSGRAIMEVYSKSSVENGTAGVMNTIFAGEAYANFGIAGIIIAPVFVGLIFSAILAWFLKSRKTPLNMIIYLESFIIFKDVLQGGLVDFFYNIKFLVMIIMMVGLIHIIKCDKIWSKIKIPKALYKGEI